MDKPRLWCRQYSQDCLISRSRLLVQGPVGMRKLLQISCGHHTRSQSTCASKNKGEVLHDTKLILPSHCAQVQRQSSEDSQNNEKDGL